MAGPGALVAAAGALLPANFLLAPAWVPDDTTGGMASGGYTGPPVADEKAALRAAVLAAICADLLGDTDPTLSGLRALSGLRGDLDLLGLLDRTADASRKSTDLLGGRVCWGIRALAAARTACTTGADATLALLPWLLIFTLDLTFTTESAAIAAAATRDLGLGHCSCCNALTTSRDGDPDLDLRGECDGDLDLDLDLDGDGDPSIACIHPAAELDPDGWLIELLSASLGLGDLDAGLLDLDLSLYWLSFSILILRSSNPNLRLSSGSISSATQPPSSSELSSRRAGSSLLFHALLLPACGLPLGPWPCGTACAPMPACTTSLMLLRTCTAAAPVNPYLLRATGSAYLPLLIAVGLPTVFEPELPRKGEVGSDLLVVAEPPADGRGGLPGPMYTSL